MASQLVDVFFFSLSNYRFLKLCAAVVMISSHLSPARLRPPQVKPKSKSCAIAAADCCRVALRRAWLWFVVGFMAWIELDFTSIFNEVTLNALSLPFSPHWLRGTLLRTYGELSVSMLKCHLTNQCAHLHAIVDASVRL